jgi:hypothetical protein
MIVFNRGVSNFQFLRHSDASGRNLDRVCLVYMPNISISNGDMYGNNVCPAGIRLICSKPL